MMKGVHIKTLPITHKVGEVIAPRFWLYDENFLIGPSLWKKRWPFDEPLTCPIDTPFGHGHGQYAFVDEHYIYSWLDEHGFELPVQGVIIGEARLWGCVLRAPGGWRASHGRVHSIKEKYISRDVRISDDADLRRLRENYGVA